MSSTAFGPAMYGGASQGMRIEERSRRMRARRHGGKRTSSTCVGQKRILCLVVVVEGGEGQIGCSADCARSPIDPAVPYRIAPDRAVDTNPGTVLGGRVLGFANELMEIFKKYCNRRYSLKYEYKYENHRFCPESGLDHKPLTQYCTLGRRA